MNSLEQLRNVPAAIRRWFGSEEATDIIEQIERQFGLPADETALPDLLFDVEVRDLPLEGLADEIAYELALSPETARAIYDVIKARLLAPIAVELVAYGIGATELAALAPKPAPVPAPISPAAPKAVSPLPAPAAPFLAARPAAPASAAPAQAPVPLYRDALASQAAPAPRAAWTIGGGSGDVSGRAGTAPQPLRPAQINLGTSSARVDETLRSIFVQRETPRPQAIDYGASRVAAAPASPLPAPVPLGSMPSQAPAPGPVIAPRAEVVTLGPVPAAEPAPAEGGFVDSLIRRVAPWHHAKFGAARSRATEALEMPLPSKEVDYAADATPRPAAPVTPSMPGATPLPLTDLPQPPQS